MTKKVMSTKVDMTSHFRPRRKVNEIEVAPFKKIQRHDGRGSAYDFGEHKIDLAWNGSAFVARKAGRPKLFDDQKTKLAQQFGAGRRP